jgi:FkbM family methyltransferase
VKRPRDLRVYDGLVFRAYPDSTQPGRFVYFGGIPDYEEMTFMHRYLRPGDRFIDGGANEGMFSLLAGQLVGPSGEVHAFEAVPRYLERLHENVRRNELTQVIVHDEALGDRVGDVSFVVRGTGSRILTETDEGVVIRVRMTTLDTVLPTGDWAMGKLDVEGAETLVLSGAEELLRLNPPPVWMIEVLDRSLQRFGSSEAQLREWLGDHGYDAVLYDPEVNRFTVAPAPIWPLADLMAIQRERRDEVMARLSSVGRWSKK